MSNPRVSVICLCYNQSAFVAEAIDSVLKQTYKPIELIVVDDASTDNSVETIKNLVAQHGFQAIFNKKNLGNCRSFNLAFQRTSGSFIIDLAADDLLLPERIAVGVNTLQALPDDYGIHFCDVAFIDKNEKSLGFQYRQDKMDHVLEKVPNGDVYQDILARHFISAPSMMIKRAVFEVLSGYDDTLSYEDFDFWVRSSRIYKYAFTDQTLVKKRMLKHSLTSARYAKNGVHILSTARVCEKALKLNKTKAEDKALQQRCHYELKWAIATESWWAAQKLLNLLEKLGVSGIKKNLFQFIINIKPPVFWLTKTLLVLKIRGQSAP